MVPRAQQYKIPGLHRQLEMLADESPGGMASNRYRMESIGAFQTGCIGSKVFTLLKTPLKLSRQKVLTIG